MIYTVKIYGFSQVCNGHKVEILDGDNNVAREFVSVTVENGELQANQWIDDMNVSPVKIYTRGSSGE